MNKHLLSPNKMLGFLAIGLTLLSIFIFRNYIIPAESKPDIITPAVLPVSLLEKQKEEAAIKGINWLISNNKAISSSSASIELMYFYKTTNDEKLANELSNLIIEKANSITVTNTTFDAKNKNYLNWNYLKQHVLDGLKTKKCKNQEYAKDLRLFEQFLAKNKNEIFPNDMNLAGKLIAAYRLKKMGIGLDNFYDSVISEIRSQYNKLNNPSSENYYTYVYALTHVIYIESGYFDKYLDPQMYPLEVKELNKSLDTFLSLDRLNDSSADVMSEVLFSLKLFKIAPNEKTDMLYKKLISFQNSDGSWGINKLSMNNKYHYTMVASLALLPFTSNLRQPSDYCELLKTISK